MLSKLSINYLILFFFLSIYLLTMQANVQSSDGMSRYFITKALCDHGSLFLSQDEIGPYSYLMLEKEGKYFSKYPIGQSLIAMPFYWLGIVLSQMTSVDKIFATRFTVLILNSLINAIACLIIFLFGKRMGFTQRTSFLLSFVYGIGSTMWSYSETFFAEPLQNLLVLLVAYVLFFKENNGKNLLSCGLFMGMATITRLESIFAIPSFLLFIFLNQRKETKSIYFKRIIIFFIPIGLFLILQLFYNYLRFDSIASYGYEHRKFSYPFLKGLYRALLSSGKGFFLYNPVLLLSIPALRLFFRKKRKQALLFLLIILSYILFYAKWGSITFSPAWGARHLLILIPFLVLPLGFLIEGKYVSRKYRLLFFFLLSLSAIIQIPSICVNPQRSYYQVRSVENNPDRWVEMITFHPRYSPILLQTQSVGIVFSNAFSKGYLSKLMSDAKQGRSFRNADLEGILEEALTVNSPNFWWFYLYLYGFPSWCAFGIPIVLMVTIFLLGILIVKITNPCCDGQGIF